MMSCLAVPGKLLLLLLALWVAWPQVALALTASQVYEQVKDSVVVVKAYDQQGKPVGLGSGVMLPSGDIITNYHVVKAGVRYTVGRGKQATPATLKAGDPDKDLCLLHAPGLGAKMLDGGVFSDTPRPQLTAKPARLGQAVKLKVGEPVYAVGAPQGLELSLSEGIVSQLRGGPPPIIQTTVAISGGSSGGGLFNAEGELVGITTFYLKGGQSLNFALPVEWIGEIKWVISDYSLYDKSRVSPVPGARPKESWESRAKALVKVQDWQGLLANARRWTQAEPCDSLAWFYLAMAYRNLRRNQEAIAACREALRLKPDYAEAWFWLGTNYVDMDRYREAVEAYQEALRLKPNSAKVWNNLGFAYGSLGRHREAIEAFRESVRLKPDADAWLNLGIAYAQSGNRSAALEAARALRRYDPQKAEGLFNFIMKP